jgi:IS30 family transposase
MKYRQITSGERYAIAALRRAGHSQAEIARQLGRARSTIAREVRRNRSTDLSYSAFKADSRTRGRRSRSRRNSHFSLEDYAVVERYLRLDWSPEQVSGFLRVEGLMSISYETIYLHVWRNNRRLHTEIGDIPPAEVEAIYYAGKELMDTAMTGN